MDSPALPLPRVSLQLDRYPPQVSALGSLTRWTRGQRLFAHGVVEQTGHVGRARHGTSPSDWCSPDAHTSELGVPHAVVRTDTVTARDDVGTSSVDPATPGHDPAAATIPVAVEFHGARQGPA